MTNAIVHYDLMCKRKNYVFLMENLEMDELLDHMFQLQLLSRNMKEDVSVCRTHRDKAAKFLDILFRRGPDAFPKFIEALRKTDQLFIADKILSSLQNVQGNPSMEY